MPDQTPNGDKLYIAAITVDYIGEDADNRCDTHYMFLRAETDQAAYDLADRLAQYMTTDDGGGYISADARSVGEVTGDLPDFVTVWTDTSVPEVMEDDDEDDDDDDDDDA